MTLDRETLDQALLDAHDQNDGAALANIYTQAADRSEAAGNENETCFFLTQAYVFALEAGLPEAAYLNERLVGYGRDVAQADLRS